MVHYNHGPSQKLLCVPCPALPGNVISYASHRARCCEARRFVDKDVLSKRCVLVTWPVARIWAGAFPMEAYRDRVYRLCRMLY